MAHAAQNDFGVPKNSLRLFSRYGWLAAWVGSHHTRCLRPVGPAERKRIQTSSEVSTSGLTPPEGPQPLENRSQPAKQSQVTFEESNTDDDCP